MSLFTAEPAVDAGAIDYGPLAGLTGLKPHRGVFLVRADKPGPPATPAGAGGGTSDE